jgi:hypothetical protein
VPEGTVRTDALGGRGPEPGRWTGLRGLGLPDGWKRTGADGRPPARASPVRRRRSAGQPPRSCRAPHGWRGKELARLRPERPRPATRSGTPFAPAHATLAADGSRHRDEPPPSGNRAGRGRSTRAGPPPKRRGQSRARSEFRGATDAACARLRAAVAQRNRTATYLSSSARRPEVRTREMSPRRAVGPGRMSARRCSGAARPPPELFHVERNATARRRCPRPVSYSTTSATSPPPARTTSPPPVNTTTTPPRRTTR